MVPASCHKAKVSSFARVRRGPHIMSQGFKASRSLPSRVCATTRSPNSSWPHCPCKTGSETPGGGSRNGRTCADESSRSLALVDPGRQKHTCRFQCIDTGTHPPIMAADRSLEEYFLRLGSPPSLKKQDHVSHTTEQLRLMVKFREIRKICTRIRKQIPGIVAQ